MTATAFPDLDESIEIEGIESFDIPCDGARVWPERIAPHDDPARWIGLKKCGHHRLLCDDCKEFYLILLSQVVGFSCAECGSRQEQSNFYGFEPLNGKV